MLFRLAKRGNHLTFNKRIIIIMAIAIIKTITIIVLSIQFFPWAQALF